ncbi:hypothetical protein H6G17_07165 [Chroococcidiopsis sp. FACHB-1243]|uniref:hypothetical protein n=1 Tax=Chroococcidiopsis sp. [FACHB-1243] TaxID=2692781 RepID=UPI0019B0F9C1|nr:hypothetical protein [Chroococcidiopsis sp. [FACHB-1243]]MBD2305291.1 hypothetical protein [Chroococcidiopsis sp. [FACHB-1243]]
MYKTTISKFNIPLLLVYLIPPTVTLCFIAIFSVNAPFWDQWSLVNLFEKIIKGRVGFVDFFVQHNEHRILFPKIIYTSLAFVSKWNIRYESYFSVFLVAITFLVFYKISTLNAKRNLHISKHLTNILTCILLFSIVQYENWLWGFQLAWFLVNTCLAIAVLIISLSNKYPKRLYLAAIPCSIASFSLAHGLLTWLAVIPSIVSIKGNARQKKTRITIWLLLFLVNFVAYFINYHKPNHHPTTLFFLKNPLATLHYFFTLLGTPLIYKAILPTLAGIIFFGVFLFLTFHFVKKTNFTLNIDLEVASWISIGLFAILFAFVTTLGRAGYGVGHAMSVKYITSSILLIISTIHLLQIFLSNNSFIIGIVIGLFLMNSINQLPPISSLHLQRQAGETCLELINFIEGTEHKCFEGLLPLSFTSQLKNYAKTLEEIGLREFPKDISFITKPNESYGSIEYPSTIRNSITTSRNGSISLRGWCMLPNSQQTPKIVLFSYGSNKSFFTDVLVNSGSSNIAQAFNFNRITKIRWTANISTRFLPLGETVIKAWVYEPMDKQFIKLDGELQVNVVE